MREPEGRTESLREAQRSLLSWGKELRAAPATFGTLNDIRAWQEDLAKNIRALSKINREILEADPELSERLADLERMSNALFVRATELNEKVWREAPTDPNVYGTLEKIRVIGPILRDMDALIGDRVMDVCAGATPFTLAIPGKGRTRIAVDLVPPHDRNGFVWVEANVAQLLETPGAFEKLMERVFARNGTHGERKATAIFVSDALNYLPLSESIGAFTTLLEEDGLLVIVNQPGRTFEDGAALIHPRALRTNSELLQALRARGFEIVTHSRIFNSPEEEVRAPAGSEEKGAFFFVFRKPGWLKRKILGLTARAQSEIADARKADESP